MSRHPRQHHPRRRRRSLAGAVGLFVLCALSGCAAVSNPVVDGVPVRRLPPEVLGESREDEQSIPLTALRQKQPEAHLIGPGDVLGVYVEGVLPRDTNIPPPVQVREQGNLPPSLGFPLPVREDGTVPLPLIRPVKVEGLTLAQAQAKIVTAYTQVKEVLKRDRERVIITLIQPRRYNVLVLREDAGGTTFGTQGGYGAGVSGGSGTFFQETRRAAGFALSLPAYENDVLNALTRSGGLPGLEAENEVVIERGAYRPGNEGGAAAKGAGPPGCLDRPAEELFREVNGRGTQVLRIPLRLKPGQPLNLRPEDVILNNGDVVYVRARRGEFFYTGGLLPARAFPVPRDRDLDILQALALVGGPIINGSFNANNLSGNLVASGLGFPSPSQISVLRKTPNGGQINIIVNLNRALRDPRERLLVQPGDFIIMQQTVDEGIAQYLTTNLRFNLLGTLVRQRDLIITSTATAP